MTNNQRDYLAEVVEDSFQAIIDHDCDLRPKNVVHGLYFIGWAIYALADAVDKWRQDERDRHP